MKTDLYTKTVLTVIAVVLSINLLSDFDIMPKAYANDSTQSVVDVRIREIDPIILGTLPVEIRGTMPVNIKTIIGRKPAVGAFDDGSVYFLIDEASKYGGYKN